MASVNVFLRKFAMFGPKLYKMKHSNNFLSGNNFLSATAFPLRLFISVTSQDIAFLIHQYMSYFRKYDRESFCWVRTWNFLHEILFPYRFQNLIKNVTLRGLFSFYWPILL